MATGKYAELTEDQKKAIANADKFRRQAVNNLVKMATAAALIPNMAYIAINVDPVVATLADTEVIPNSTSLVGARDMTVAEWNALGTLLANIVKMQSDPANLPLIIASIGMANAN